MCNGSVKLNPSFTMTCPSRIFVECVYNKVWTNFTPDVYVIDISMGI